MKNLFRAHIAQKVISLILVGMLLSSCVSTKVKFNTNIEGAKVTVDGKTLGETPIESTKIKNNQGRNYQVIIEKEGYKTYHGYLRTEDKKGAIAASVAGYFFLFPLLIYGLYISGPTPDQYFVLEPESAD